MKDMLKNKRIDDAELEKVSGGVDAVDTDRYKEFSIAWMILFSPCTTNTSSKHYQSLFDIYWYNWSKDGFKPDAMTFIKKDYEIICDLIRH